MIKLRNLRMSDAQRLLDLVANENVLKHMALGRFKLKDLNLNFEKRWLKKTLSDYKFKEPLKFYQAIILDGKLVGSIGGDLDHYNKKCVLGYWIGEDFWGKGIVPKALKLLVKKLNNGYGIRRFVVDPLVKNKASCRVAEKAGFKLESISKKSYMHQGRLSDQAIYVRIMR